MSFEPGDEIRVDKTKLDGIKEDDKAELETTTPTGQVCVCGCVCARVRVSACARVCGCVPMCIRDVAAFLPLFT